METITAYKLSDGTIVESEKEAIETEKVLTFKNEIFELLNKNDVSVYFRDWDDFVEFIGENGEEFLKILSKRFAK